MPDDLKSEIIIGDNLNLLTTMVAESPPSIQLAYLDPPFNSDRAYNVLVEDSQVHEEAYIDTWKHDKISHQLYTDTIARKGRTPMGRFLKAQHDALLPVNPSMFAYMVAMAPRLDLLHSVLLDTGTCFLHCDPTASHYLKTLMDQIFGGENFRSEIIWKRATANNNARRPGAVHDVILFYSKTAKYVWNPIYHKYTDEHRESWEEDPDGRLWQAVLMTGSGERHGFSGQPWRGIMPHSEKKLRHWAISGTMAIEYERRTGSSLDGNTQERLDALDETGLIVWRDGHPWFKMYMDQAKGVPVHDIWTDIAGVNSKSSEFANFDTQKPVALLERIVACGSNPGDWVLDPYVGSGTTAIAARRLGRHFRGFENESKNKLVAMIRLEKEFAGLMCTESNLSDHPTNIESFNELAASDRSGRKCQEWALKMLGGLSTGRGGDAGVDGNITMMGFADHRTRNAIVQVKSGTTHLGELERLCFTRLELNRGSDGVDDDEKGAALIAVFVAKEEFITSGMRAKARSQGFYNLTIGGVTKTYPRVQILAVEDFFDRTKPLAGLDLPGIVRVPDYSQTKEAIDRKRKRVVEQDLATQQSIVRMLEELE